MKRTITRAQLKIINCENCQNSFLNEKFSTITKQLCDMAGISINDKYEIVLSLYDVFEEGVCIFANLVQEETDKEYKKRISNDVEDLLRKKALYEEKIAQLLNKL